MLFPLFVTHMVYSDTLEITQWVERFLTSLDDDSVYLVDINWSKKSQKLEVFIESDDDLTLGDVQKISREMQRSMDDQGILGDNYRLDVSSPGVDRPLKLRRQYKKNLGRIVNIEFEDGSIMTGKMKAVNDEGLVIEPEIPGYKKKKPTYGNETNIHWEKIKKTIVQIRF